MHGGNILERLEKLERTTEELKEKIEREREERIENINELEEKIKEEDQGENPKDLISEVLLEIIETLEWEIGIDFREVKKALGWRPGK